MARILIVEDEAILAMSLQMQLRAMGHEVLGTAESADCALSLLEKARPELILMDIVLHGEMSGIELAAIVNERYRVPVLYGTAHTDAATLKKANATQHAGILYKPYQLHELKAAIDRALGH